MPHQLRLEDARVQRDRDDPLLAMPPSQLKREEDVRKLALVVQVLRTQLPTRGTILERLEIEMPQVRIRGGRDDDARMAVRGRRLSLQKRGQEQLGEEKRPKDVRPELQVVSIRCHLRHRGPHHTSAINRSSTS